MKNSFRLALACLVLAPAALVAASFEGKVNFRMTGERGKPQDIAYHIKGDKVRIEMPGQKGMGGMVMDLAKKESMIFMDDQKMYMVMAIPDAATQAAKEADDVKLEKTGEKEKILGYTAEKFISTHQGNKTELWLAEGLGAYLSFSNQNPMGGGRRGGGSSAQAWERALAGKDLFPLRVVGRDKGGKESFRMEATAIEKQSLPDSLFSPPAGYQKFDMGGMMKGMIPGMK